jgi:taurine dioxygenase
MSQITVTQLGFSLGAEVTGIDLKEPLNDLTKHEILQAWLKHLVLVFPGQDLTPKELITFSGSFGELDKNERLNGLQPGDPEHEEILVITTRPIEGKPSASRMSGRSWHSDLTFTTRPAKASFLNCKQKPPVGGDTMFANMYAAYETLSPAMQEFLEKREAIHDASLIKGIENREPSAVADLKRRNPPVAHPVVRIHPETGRKALFLGKRIRGFVGMTEEESTPILNFLNDHATSPEFVYRHRWSVHDLLMWDNRSTMHLALADFDQTQVRHMIRTSLHGEPSGYVVKEEAPQRESLIQAIAAVS